MRQPRRSRRRPERGLYLELITGIYAVFQILVVIWKRLHKGVTMLHVAQARNCRFRTRIFEALKLFLKLIPVCILIDFFNLAKTG